MSGPATSSSQGVHAHRVIFIDLARALAVVFMLYGHTIDALLAPGYRAGTWYDVWQFQRGLTSSLFLMLSGFAFSIATGRHWTSHLHLSTAARRRLRRFLWFVFLGYSLHFPVGRVIDLPYATTAAWRAFMAVDVLQLIGVTFVGVQCLVMIARTREAFALLSLSLAVAIVALSPLFWSIDWSGWLPLAVSAYLSPALGPQYPLFPAFPWSAFILIGASLGQVYSRWGGAHLEAFANRVLLVPGVGIVAAGYAVAWLPILGLDAGARSVLALDILIRTGACMVILGLIAQASRQVTRLPHVFSALAQETLVIYFIHLCIVYGSAWSIGLAQVFGPTLGPGATAGCVVALLASMSVLASGWNWLKHARPQTARWAAYAGGAALVGGILF